MVAAVSCAMLGSTSMDTRPSAGVSSWTGASTSQALRTSSVVSWKITRSVLAPSSTSFLTWSSYRSPLAIAAAKIVGFVVTPTTLLSLTRSARLPVSMRSRERSSSQMETPASASACSRSFMGSSSDRGGRSRAGSQPVDTRMLSRAASATARAVMPYSSKMRENSADAP